MAEPIQCAECDENIDGEIIWYRPLGKLEWEDQHTARFIAQASSKPMDNGLPFHPTCWEFRMGVKWAPDSQ